MRFVLVLAVAALVALPAAVAGVDPGALVLRQADVPVGFRLVPDESDVRTNAREARELPESRDRFRRWGRVTGFRVLYRRSDARIDARADVFRTNQGAANLLSWVHAEMRRAGISGQRLVPVRIGDQGWVFFAGGSYTLVAWRQGVVFAAVFGDGIARARTIDVARAQQRRVVAALR